METNIKDRFLRRFKKENTIKTYEVGIRKFYNYIIEKKNYDTEEEILLNTTVDDMEDYVIYLEVQKQFKMNTINKDIEVLKEFFEYVVKRHMIQFNPTDTLTKFSKNEVEAEKKEKETLTLEELKKLIDTINAKKITSEEKEFLRARDVLVVFLLATSGCRAEELFKMKWSWLEETNLGYVINIPEEFVKNKIAKRVPIVKSIERYFKYYKAFLVSMGKNNPDDYFFISRNGNRYTAVQSCRNLEKYTKKAGIEKNITNHSFRHGLTQYLVKKEVQESMIYKIMGWKEQGIQAQYSGKSADPQFDKIKFEVCDILKG